MAASVVDENLAHKLGGDGEEVPAAFKVEGFLPDEACVGFVHESGALQGMIGALFPQLEVSQAVEFFIDLRDQGVQGVAVAGPPYLQQARYIAGKLGAHGFSRRRKHGGGPE